jgi:endonuclease-3
MALARPRSVRKKPLDIPLVVRRIRSRVSAVADAAMFELKDTGHASLFEQLVACIISIRTRDEVSLPAARRLFAAAPTPDAIARLGASRIDRLIGDATFHESKARWIHAMAVRTRDEFDGTLPCDADVLTSFPGVGPKCANLALGIACGQSRISVDVHVHRVTNRWGYVRTATPEKTMVALEQKLPKRYWIEINRLLVPFGKHVCTGRLPKCSECPVEDMCRQVGVEAHR